MELKFKVDTKHRKDWFTGVSFSHPAKMSLPLQLWLIENYTKVGDTILDPMAGSGTVLVACSLGRNVVAVELESKFIDIMEGNSEKIKQRGPQLGYDMGWCEIIQGDARNLDLLADTVISSPPYGNRLSDTEVNDGDPQRMSYRQALGKLDTAIFSPPYALTVQSGHEGVQAWKVIEGLKNADTKTLRAKSKELSEQGKIVNQYGNSKDNIGNLKYGEIDAVISSPPYSDIERRDRSKEDWWDEEREKKFSGGSAKIARGYQADAVITSPPYEGSMDGGSRHTKGDIPERDKAMKRIGSYDTTNQANIGNLYKDTYLEAMLQVYQQCYKCLKPEGLLILVLKNFIRNKQVVRLDLDTLKLCEQAGFVFKESHQRKLPAQSFWRVIYHRQYPSVPMIEYEDILIFGRG